eukprot:CAMPEP_0176174234 /NCGR_PEP_ID=MMETSP0120_2-20121206/89268_1 /TAXON_ID=160619 /ORGANISM="Kryptoperidinium foliaceum, Strain CCMP 1326" /LENGTH=139 /DNA_ID=CAMNT_0017512269 /DNA_START=491 /DNA_END=907 /DNA_ORIENTATION=-
MPARTPFVDILHLLLSCQNNRMTIYQEFAMHRESHACLELLTFLLAVIPTYRSTGQLGPLEPSTIMDHEILLNLMVLVRTESAAAAKGKGSTNLSSFKEEKEVFYPCLEVTNTFCPTIVDSIFNYYSSNIPWDGISRAG